MTKRKKAIDILDKVIQKTPQPFKFILTLFRFFPKLTLSIIIIIAVTIYATFNLHYVDGKIELIPTIKAEIKKEL